MDITRKSVIKVKRNILLVSLIACLLVLSLEANGQDSTKHTAVFNQKWLKTIVSLEILDTNGIGKPIGTGFLIETPNKHIALVTAKHVVYQNEGKGPLVKNIAYRLNRKDGNSILIADTIASTQLNSGWFRSEKIDVACRLIFREVKSDVVTIPDSMFLSTQLIESGTPLFIIGYPMGMRSDQYATPIVRRASIARVDPERFIVDGIVYPGNSGGPVIYEPSIQLGKGFTTPILQGDWLVWYYHIFPMLKQL